MLKNEKFYEKDDLRGMLKGSEISGDEMQGDYFAIGDNGKAYHATFVNKYRPSGVFYSIIPAEVKILGYVPANNTLVTKKEQEIKMDGQDGKKAEKGKEEKKKDNPVKKNAKSQEQTKDKKARVRRRAKAR